MEEDIELTKEEKLAIKRFKKLAAEWPSSLWVFSASSRLHIMRCGEGGEQVTDGWGAVDPAYKVDAIDIPSDGGEW